MHGIFRAFAGLALAGTSVATRTVTVLPFGSPFTPVPVPSDLMAQLRPQFGHQMASPREIADSIFTRVYADQPWRGPGCDPDNLGTAIKSRDTDPLFDGFFGLGSGLPDNGLSVAENVRLHAPERCPTVNGSAFCEGVRSPTREQKEVANVIIYGILKALDGFIRVDFGQMPSIVAYEPIANTSQAWYLDMADTIVIPPTLSENELLDYLPHEFLHHLLSGLPTHIEECIVESVSSHALTRKFLGNIYEAQKSDLFTMCALVKLQGSKDVLTQKVYHDGMRQLVRSSVSPLFAPPNSTGGRPQLETTIREVLAPLGPNSSFENGTDFWNALGKIQPVKVQLADGEIVYYSPGPAPASTVRPTVTVTKTPGVTVTIVPTRDAAADSEPTSKPAFIAGMTIAGVSVVVLGAVGAWYFITQKREAAPVDANADPAGR